MNIPPLPPGFEMVSDTPPPPPGFEIVGQPKAKAEPMSAWDRFVQGARDPLDAGAQMLSRMPGAGAVNRATQAVNNMPGIGPITKALGMTPATSEKIDADISARESAYRAPEGVDWARAGGNTAAMLPLLAIPGGGSMRGAIASGVATGAASGALQPVTDSKGDFWTDKGAQAGIGAAFGGVAAPVMRGAARVINPETSDSVKLLMKEGVTPTPGRILGGAFASLEDRATSTPILGDAIRSAQRSSIEDFNRAAYARAVKPIGGQVPTQPGRDAVSDVSGQLSAAYNNLLPKLTFKADQQFASEFGTINQMVGSLPPQQAQQFERIVRDKLVGKMTPAGLMSGESLKAAESELGRIARGYRGSPDFDTRQLGDALRSLQQSMRDALQRTNPTHSAELARINEGYAAFSRIRDAASRQGSAEGVFTPAQFSAAVRSQDKSAGKGAYAKGTAGMQDLSDAGRTVLGNPYPDSGTAGRLMGNPAALAAGFMNPMIPGALSIASAPYLPVGRQIAAGLLARRPGFAEPVAEGVKRLPAGLLAPMLYPLLNQ
jgi:hypothetical protein